MTEYLLRVVIDTNIWISAFINPRGAPAAVIRAFLQERYLPVISQPLLDEIESVLLRPRIHRRLRVDAATRATLLEQADDYGIKVFPEGRLQLCRDPKDNFLLETAILGEARYLVSRDDDVKRDLDLSVHLREHDVEVLSVAQFLEVLASE